MRRSDCLAHNPQNTVCQQGVCMTMGATGGNSWRMVATRPAESRFQSPHCSSIVACRNTLLGTGWQARVLRQAVQTPEHVRSWMVLGSRERFERFSELLPIQLPPCTPQLGFACSFPEMMLDEAEGVSNVETSPTGQLYIAESLSARMLPSPAIPEKHARPDLQSRSGLPALSLSYLISPVLLDPGGSSN